MREKITEEQHKNRIYNWLYNETKPYSELTVGVINDPRWYSTIDISSYINLPIDRVNYICNVHKKIGRRGEKEFLRGEPCKEMWGIRFPKNKRIEIKNVNFENRQIIGDQICDKKWIWTRVDNFYNFVKHSYNHMHETEIKQYQ